MSNCEMCGQSTSKSIGRWHQYDNGEQFIATVCQNCAELHDRLANK